MTETIAIPPSAPKRLTGQVLALIVGVALTIAAITAVWLFASAVNEPDVPTQASTPSVETNDGSVVRWDVCEPISRHQSRC